MSKKWVIATVTALVLTTMALGGCSRTDDNLPDDQKGTSSTSSSTSSSTTSSTSTSAPSASSGGLMENGGTGTSSTITG